MLETYLSSTFWEKKELKKKLLPPHESILLFIFSGLLLDNFSVKLQARKPATSGWVQRLAPGPMEGSSRNSLLREFCTTYVWWTLLHHWSGPLVTTIQAWAKHFGNLRLWIVQWTTDKSLSLFNFVQSADYTVVYIVWKRMALSRVTVCRL